MVKGIGMVKNQKVLIVEWGLGKKKKYLNEFGKIWFHSFTQCRLELVMDLFTHSIKYNHMNRDEEMRRGESTESGENEKEREQKVG